MDDLINGNNIPLPDLTYLNKMADGDQSFVKEIVNIFLEACPPMLSSLKESAEKGDHENLRQISHKLITQLSSVGILSAINDVKRINKGSKDMPDLVETVDRIIKISNHGIHHLKTMV